MSTWREVPEPPPRRIGPAGWALALGRGLVLGLVVYLGLAILLVLRLVERPLFGRARPITPHVTQTVCRLALPILGLRLTCHGRPMRHPGAVVANHSSWLDIFVLNAADRIYFVSKAEVARWPGIGWLARATGTVFITRDPREAKAQQRTFEDRLHANHRLLFFPEGTSSDGRRVLPFKPTLFAAFFTHGLDREMQIQPVSVVYHAPPGLEPRFYGWWGDMDFGPHLLGLLATPRRGKVTVTFHSPVPVSDHPDRKSLAAACESTIRNDLSRAIP